jgi:hypothetical protein
VFFYPRRFVDTLICWTLRSGDKAKGKSQVEYEQTGYSLGKSTRHRGLLRTEKQIRISRGWEIYSPSTQIGKYSHLQLRLEIYSPSTQIGKYIHLQLRLENIFTFKSDWKIYSPSTQIGKYIHLQLRLENIFTFNSASLSRLRLMALAPNIFPLLAKTWRIYHGVPPWEKVARYPNSDSTG